VNNLEWEKLVVAIMDGLIISQADLAARCSVAQQTVSTWKKGTRTPSVHARRQLIALANEAGLSLSYFSRASRFVSYGDIAELPVERAIDDQTSPILAILRQLPLHDRQDVTTYARYKLDSHRRIMAERSYLDPVHTAI
jgi:transcriptional regulator with XRE-family HTH domain